MDSFFIILIVLIFSAFFSGMEIAFFSSDKLQIELDRKQNHFSSFFISVFLKKPEKYIATLLIGNNVALVIYGIIMAEILEPSILKFIESEMIVLFLQTIFSTFLILITAEFLPKTIFRSNSNRSMRNFSVFTYFFYVILYPITTPIVLLTNLLLGKRNKISNQKAIFGKIDLDNFLNKNQDIKEKNDLENEVKIFQNALDFSNISVRECMIPRTEIIAVKNTDSIELLREKFIETGYSKILIYKESIDDIIAYVHSSFLFSKPKNISEILSKMPIVPETMSAQKLLKSFMKERKSIALVVDEFGGTSGIVTVEDIVEEIFGEIEDEHDSKDLDERQINEKEFHFSGRLEVDYLNEKYNLAIPKTDEYNTISGFIYHYYESIPKYNQKIKIFPFEFTILKANKKQILLVHLKIKNF